MNLKDTYNKITEDWFKDHKEDTWWVEGTNKFISFLKPGNLVLDLGCGAGVKSKFLIKKKLKVLGIDFSKKQIDIAKREVPEAKFWVMDIKDIDKLSEEFDGIFAQAIFLHIPNNQVKDIICNLLTKLKKKGYLYIAVKERKPGGKIAEIRAEEDYGYRYERFFSYFTLDEIKTYLKELGMEICYENVLPSGNTNWIQVISKK